MYQRYSPRRTHRPVTSAVGPAPLARSSCCHTGCRVAFTPSMTNPMATSNGQAWHPEGRRIPAVADDGARQATKGPPAFAVVQTFAMRLRKSCDAAVTRVTVGYEYECSAPATG